MGERAKGTASASLGQPGARGARTTAALPLALFCSVMGTLAVGLGAAAAFLVPGGVARGLVWLVVTALVAVAAGLWWGLTPVTERLRILHHVLAAAEPRAKRHHR
ncbi:hypothetical protein [Streptomyces pseudovenezuelae]|uniref:hypothetical protein n=1 Tax=Streptomyces pseudovenezuelae TaxID=67350 RepID=UPI002E824858|nr:hypothetical protein [Streptomyces pseudovenezuelae]WUA91873.1 hypothetical protein OHO81_33195 [Streptomyces pseudovenezuelae]